MNTKLIMTLSALFCAILGIGLTFAPAEISTLFNASSTSPLILQLTGAVFFAFAMLNWTAKGAIIGGIYNKAISLANFTHFFIGAMALIKATKTFNTDAYYLWAITIVYVIFAILFGLISFKHPVAAENSKD